ncbi:UNVERIFIED_CONTAM: hypothetical protein GTU68_043323 [Idotea baltica]|nr:hypothetical protein [Idotea baltica]
MRETWRWFGEFDPITLGEVAQTGAEGIVSALHAIPYGEVWLREAIAKRRDEIEAAGFTWDVVESLPVHEDIKRGTGDLPTLFGNYRASLANLAREGVKTICYNFMPILDWTRTDLAAPTSRGGTCLQFSAAKMAAFEIHMMSGLPGAVDRYDINGLRAILESYRGLSHDDLRANLARFLQEVVPTATELGVNLCIHPDDPPRDILGLPRVVSTASDIRWIMRSVDTAANGLTLCTGSLGSRPNNDIPSIAQEFASRIHFAHLRNVTTQNDGSFSESAHLEGDVDLVAVIDELLEAETSREVNLPFRADHGHTLLSDTDRDFQPGYSLIGRLRGLAELRGAIAALT